MSFVIDLVGEMRLFQSPILNRLRIGFTFSSSVGGQVRELSVGRRPLRDVFINRVA